MNKHGYVNFYWHEDILTLELEGPFNEEGLNYYFSLVKTSILNRSGKNWRRLEIWDEETLGSLETLGIGKDIDKWFEENGCLLAAVVVSNSLQKQVLENIIKSNMKIFRNEIEARKWLVQNT